MRTYLTAYFSTFVILLAMDAAWLSLAGGLVYKAKIGHLMLDKPNLSVAIFFYIMYAFTMIIFAVLPAIQQGSWIRALWAGALLGFTAYGAYDITNQATLVGWSSFVSIVDMAWGTVVTANAATAGYFITRAFS